MTATTKERKAKTGGIRLSAAALKAGLNAVAAAVPGKTAKPILHNVLLSDGVLSGTDLEIRIDVEVDAPPGVTFLLPKDRLSAIVSSTTADEITLTPDGSSCVVSAGRGTWTLPTEDAAEFPVWDPIGTKSITRLPADQFVRAVKGVVFAADTESSKYALGAVLIEVEGEVVTFVATDGRRLSRVTCEHDLAVDDRREPKYKREKVEPGVLVPARVMSIIARLADQAGDGSVQLEATGKEVVATVGTVTITASLMEGKFPRWRDVFPDREVKATTVDRASLLAATRAAAICSSEESRGVEYAFTSDGIWLHGQSAEKGESSVTCEVLDAGKKCNVKLDPSFVIEWLNGISGDSEPNVEIEAVDDQSAVVLRCGDNTGVIMPLAKD